MKLVMVIMLLFALARNSFAQGEIAFVNSSQQPVLDFRTGEPVVAGNTFLAALYFAQDGIFDETQFVQVGSAADFWVPGVFNGGARTAPTAVRGGYGMFQVRAWESAFGSTYEQAVAAPPQNGRYALFGKSNIFRADTADPDHPTEPPTSILTYGFRSFYLIPEPNTVSLLALFTTALLFWRFRQGFE